VTSKEDNKLTDASSSISVKLLITVGVGFECEKLKDFSALLLRHFSRKYMNI
jgi:hypothetical protein